MLIDGGGSYEDRFDIGKNVIAPFLWNKKITKIDYLVLTHPDPDHLNGLIFVASHFTIGQFWSTGLKAESEAYSQLEDALDSEKVQRLSFNDKSPPLMIEGVSISFLNPPETKRLQRASKNRMETNNASLVMKLQFKQVSLLLAADVGEEAEYRMMREGYRLKADLLKIPHHGSASSSSSPFLERVKPTYAVLSVGERNIGHLPKAEVMKRYDQIGAKVFRTDEHGAITVITDGEKINVKSLN